MSVGRLEALTTLLVSGTDTDVGKTVLTTALAAYWLCGPNRPNPHQSSQKIAILKPIQAGPGDRELYHRLLPLDQTLEQINPIYFQAPLAPPLAAEQEGRQIELDRVWQTYQSLQKKYDVILIEALGGLGSPITRELTVADLARDWCLPVVLVVPVKLGAIGQAVANVALARQSRLQLKGIVLNCVQPCSAEAIASWAPKDLIESLTQVPVLGALPYLSNPTDLAKLAQVASNLDLEYLGSSKLRR